MLKNISVIVATKNRPEYLFILLRALEKQLVLPYEIIIVSASDYKHRITETKKVKEIFPSIIYIPVKNINKSYSLNIGLGRISSQSHIIAFTDDDCIPKNDWIEKIMKYHNKYRQDLLITGGVEKFTPDYLSRLYEEFVLPKQQISERTLFCGGNVSFKKRFFFQQKLKFDESLDVCEDLELSEQIRKKGYRILFIKDISVKHAYRWNYFDFLRRFFYYGYGEFNVYSKHNRNHYLTPGRRYRHIRFFLNLPYAYYNLLKDYFSNGGSLNYIFFGYLVAVSAKIFGVYFGLLQSHISANVKYHNKD